MSWERRARGGFYYVRKRRVGGRPASEYIGAGLAGVLAAELDSEDRAEREAKRDSLRAEQERWEAVDAAIAEVCEATDLTARAALVLAGYHQHHRGEWRRWRERKAR